jgi:ketosteroid isomerase-like protein
MTNNEADVAAIEAVFRDQIAKFKSGDSEGWFALLSEDIVVMPPNAKIAKGKDAARQWGQPYFDQFTINQTASLDEIKVFGDWALGRGPFKDEFVPKKEGDTIIDIGKFLYIFRRQADKSWKITHAIWNSD